MGYHEDDRVEHDTKENLEDDLGEGDRLGGSALLAGVFCFLLEDRRVGRVASHHATPVLHEAVANGVENDQANRCHHKDVLSIGRIGNAEQRLDD